VGNAGGRGQDRDALFVHSSLNVNEDLVKAKEGVGVAEKTVGLHAK